MRPAVMRAIVVAAVAVVVLSGISVYGKRRQAALMEEEGPQLGDPATVVRAQPGDPGAVTFRVRVPAVTPARDVVALHLGLAVFGMSRAADGSHVVAIDFSSHPDGSRFTYGYSRGGFHPFAEVGFNEDVTRLPREFTLGRATVVDDVVAEWKWLPNAPPVEPPVESWAGNATVAPRARFMGGPHLPDWWEPSFELQYNATAARIADRGYEWVAISPPWSVAPTDPPRICADCKEGEPTFSDAELRAHIRWLKSQDLKVLMRAQVGNPPGDLASRDAAWWNAWFDEYEAFVRSHATVAREEGVDAFTLSGAHATLPNATGVPPLAHDRWQRVFDAAEESGVPVSYDVYGFGDELPWPWSDIDFFDRMDYLALNFGPALSDGRDPSQAELDANMSREWAGVDRAHAITGLPVVLSSVHYESIVGGGRTPPEHLDIFYDPALANYTYYGRTQALALESLFREVAKRPWVEGVFSWGYAYHDALTPEGSIRGKPAEDVFAGWVVALDRSAAT